MYPELFRIGDFTISSYSVCLILGIVLAFIIALVYIKKRGINKAGFIDIGICSCFSIVFGLIFSILFENLYEFIEKGKSYNWTWGMTFFGGLFGGIIGFIVIYLFLKEDKNFNIFEILKVAPVSISAAHALGRIGCFLAGCCYGKPTDSWIGLPCSHANPGLNVIPVQLFEAFFLATISLIMGILLFKKKFSYNFVFYMATYSVFRFIIEFFRDDPRGVFGVISPSQIWSILMFFGAPAVFFLLRKFENNHESK